MESPAFPWDQQLVLDLSAWCPWSTHNNYWNVQAACHALQAPGPPTRHRGRQRWRSLSRVDRSAVFPRKLGHRSGEVIDLVTDDSAEEVMEPGSSHPSTAPPCKRVHATGSAHVASDPGSLHRPKWSRTAALSTAANVIDLEHSPVDEEVIDGLWQALFMEDVD